MLIYNTGIGIGMPVLLGLTIRAAKKKKPAPKIPQGPMFHGDSISDQVKESKNTISCSKQHFNHQIQESVKEKAPKLQQRPMFYDDSNLDNNENENENENAIYVISGNDYHH